ncbi:thiamine phosphate synthase [Methylovirgula sp. 4M-Z18]|uniref:thiamine phosphate synthase n=1 Tax=Methylovirgula sp. 4M-Z18 TaxID=2293567 RepID=UPI000E2FD5FA|nr:thiamine phosphate synthase [Methylovirgula sp. 4M-Z18]RFB78711.1 thiamine phosphate synthase [Methylovirgula sp. 4M-Z18]
MSDQSPQLYLLTPPLQDGEAFAPQLKAACTTSAVACVLVRAAPGADLKKIAKSLVPLIQQSGAAALIDGDPRIAAHTQADGAHIRFGGEELSGALQSLKPDRIVGVGGLKLRDDAMTAGESGADYVMFGEPAADGYVPPASVTLEKVQWWADIFSLPCVGFAATIADVAPLSAAGADFVALGDAVWQDPRGVAEAVQEAHRLLLAHARVLD